MKITCASELAFRKKATHCVAKAKCKREARFLTQCVNNHGSPANFTAIELPPLNLWGILVISQAP